MKDILLICETKDKARKEFERMRVQLSIMIKSSNRSKLRVTLKSGRHIYFESSNRGKTAVVGVGTDIDVLSEQISEIVEIRQRLGRINRYANKFKYWNNTLKLIYPKLKELLWRNTDAKKEQENSEK